MPVTSRGHWTTKLTSGQYNLWDGVHRLRMKLLIHFSAQLAKVALFYIFWQWKTSYLSVSLHAKINFRSKCLLLQIFEIKEWSRLKCQTFFFSQNLCLSAQLLPFCFALEDHALHCFLHSLLSVCFSLLLIPSCCPLFSVHHVYVLTCAASQPFNGLI